MRSLISSALSVSQVPQEAPWRLSDGFLTCSGAPQVHFGGSWRLWEALGVCKIKIHRACRCLRSCQRAPRGSPRHDPSALSVFGRLTNHDLSCLLMSGGVPECSEVMICRACRCLEASRNALKSRSIVPVGVWRPPGWRLDVFGSATSSSWRILEALGGSRSFQNQDLLALSASGRLTSHDLSCLSVSGGLPECSEVTICRACQCLEASQGATRPSEPLSADLIVGGLGPALQRSLDL